MFISGWYVVWTLFLKKFKFVRELLGTNSETDVQEKPKRSRGKLRRDWSSSEVYNCSCNQTFCDMFLRQCVHSRWCAIKDRPGSYLTWKTLANDLTECKMYGSTCNCALGWKAWKAWNHLKDVIICAILLQNHCMCWQTLFIMFWRLLYMLHKYQYIDKHYNAKWNKQIFLICYSKHLVISYMIMIHKSILYNFL